MAGSRKKGIMSDLKCQCCGYIRTIPRKQCQKRERNHVKDMWCPICSKESKFIENYL